MRGISEAISCYDGVIRSSIYMCVSLYLDLFLFALELDPHRNFVDYLKWILRRKALGMKFDVISHEGGYKVVGMVVFSDHVHTRVDF